VDDLYEIDLSQAAWVKPCGGNSDDNGDEESCVLVADTPDVVAARDSKNPTMAALRFTKAEMDAFVRHYARENNLMIQDRLRRLGSRLGDAGPFHCPQGRASVVGKS
jgi:hypothetical protein